MCFLRICNCKQIQRNCRVRTYCHFRRQYCPVDYLSHLRNSEITFCLLYYVRFFSYYKLKFDQLIHMTTMCDAQDADTINRPIVQNTILVTQKTSITCFVPKNSKKTDRKNEEHRPTLQVRVLRQSLLYNLLQLRQCHFDITALTGKLFLSKLTCSKKTLWWVFGSITF